MFPYKNKEKTMYKHMNMIIWTFLFLLFLGMFNDADAAKVYVIGSPTDLPGGNKLLPVKIKVVDIAAYDAYVMLSLYRTSSMNGRCTNYPINSKNTRADLELSGYGNSGSRWTDFGANILKYKLPDSDSKTTHEFTVNVCSYDYGAYGQLSATLYGNIGHGVAKLDENTGTVPRDENGNNIADGWENDFYPYKWDDESIGKIDYNRTKQQSVIKNYTSTADAENDAPTNNEHGDGFTVFEEYRGFMTEKGKAGSRDLYSGASGHIRTSPHTKNVFCVVHSSISTYGMGSASSHGIVSFTEMFAGGVSRPFEGILNDKHNRLKLFLSKELGWINTNSDGISDRYVYAVRIQNFGMHPEQKEKVDKGKANEIEGWILGRAYQSKPNKKSLTYIYVDTITMSSKYDKTHTLSQWVNSTIGHEVGHTVNLAHCSDACVKATAGTGCMMRPSSNMEYVLNGKTITENALIAGVHSTHDVDYDLADSVKSPQKEATYQRPKKKKAAVKNLSVSLFSASSVYTAAAGESHTANFSASEPYSSLYWYVKGPSDTTYGAFQGITKGDGSRMTDTMTYTFPSGVSGEYEIKTMVYLYPTTSSTYYEDSYTVSVSSSTTTTTTTPSVSLVSSDGVYTASAGDKHTAKVTAPEAIYSVTWYIASPGTTGRGVFAGSTPGDGSATTADLDYTFPSGVSGDYQITALVYKHSDMSLLGEASYTVTVSLPSSSTTTTFSPSVTSSISGRTVTFTITAGAPIYGTYLIASGKNNWHTGDGSNTQTLTYTYPDTVAAGTYSITLAVYPVKGNSYGLPEWLYPIVTLPSQ